MEFNMQGIFEGLSGIIFTVSFLVSVFCLATLRSCVDEEKIRKEENISSIVKAPIPPERVLSEVGLRRAKIAKISIGIWFAVGAIIVISQNVIQ